MDAERKNCVLNVGIFPALGCHFTVQTNLWLKLEFPSHGGVCLLSSQKFWISYLVLKEVNLKK